MSQTILPHEFEHRNEDARDDGWCSLIRLAQLGDQEAFEQLYLRSARWLLARIRRIVTDGDAEDVLAEAYIQVWRTIGTYDERRASPAAWLSMIAKSRALDHLRARKSRGPCVALDEEEFPVLASDEDPEEAFARGKNAKLLHECLHALAGNERLVISLSFFSGYTLEEISQAMNMPVATIKRHMLQARRKLKVQLASTPLESFNSAGKSS